MYIFVEINQRDMSLITVTVYKDNSGTYPNGSVRSIPAESTIDTKVGYLSMVEVLEGRHNLHFANKQLLRVNVPDDGFVFIDETVDSFNGKVATTNGGSPQSYVITLKGNVDGAAGNIVTSSRLYNLAGKIQSITLGGVAIYGVPYSSDPIGLTGSLDVTNMGGWGDLEVIEITVKY